ncbi:BtrH N-terminal domain-containing protein [Streptomyces sp. NPDC048045]|uniref:BtrH N-terminal domain-containing protein n=1 Tax=Streptomyces sp. NPDC048045 TaxID=3154710 RepID=UPI00343B4526
MAMVKDIDPRGMQHCETTALGVLLRHEGLDLSEPMLFGLGSGLSFIYWDSKGMGFPFLGGRVKPFELARNGIEKTAEQVPKWLQRSDNPQEDLPRAAVLMEKGGTGGALFRNLYRDFLAECAQLIDSAHLRTGHSLYAEAATLWTQAAALMTTAGETGDAENLVQAGSVLVELTRIERDAMRALSMLQHCS